MILKLYKYLLLIFYLSIFTTCNSKKNIPEKQYVEDEITIEEIKQEDLNKDKEESFRLNDNNVIEFLFEYEKNNKENKVRIYTSEGNIDILLFNNTPYHRANFIYLTKNNYFSETQFYRVIDNFVIQAGNSDDTRISMKRNKIGKYLLPNDFNKGYTHDRGVVSMPSSEIDNPYKLASPFEFFIVQKKDGAKHLDGEYTIFGKVISGMEVVDRIASSPTDNIDWPLNNIYINKVEIIN
ncbi:MAG: peptidylprolyl isomerase [Bacteroidota bacterium]